MEADLLFAQCFIEPHLFAGFSGARNRCCPESLLKSPSWRITAASSSLLPNARPGILKGNPIHQDMLSMGRGAAAPESLTKKIEFER
jgi:nickel-dependent lactate racemase